MTSQTQCCKTLKKWKWNTSWVFCLICLKFCRLLEAHEWISLDFKFHCYGNSNKNNQPLFKNKRLLFSHNKKSVSPIFLQNLILPVVAFKPYCFKLLLEHHFCLYKRPFCFFQQETNNFISGCHSNKFEMKRNSFANFWHLQSFIQTKQKTPGILHFHFFHCLEVLRLWRHILVKMRLKTYKMMMSILPKFLTLKWNISKTIWRIEVGDGQFFCIFHSLSFELNFFFGSLEETKNRFFFSSLSDRVLLDKSNEPCPAFVRYRYPIEKTPQIFHFSYFSREATVQENLVAPFFEQNDQTTLCLKGFNIRLQEDRRMKVGLMSPWNIGNDSVINCFFATLIWIQK